MPLCYSAIPSRSLRRDGADLKGFGISQQAFCRAKFAFAQRSGAMKAPVGLLSDRTVCDSRWRVFAPTSSAHDAQNADNARKNTAFPPVCKKCAKVCRAPEKGKSHEESYDSSWDFGALEGTRIPGPLIKSQMLYRLSYERIFCGKTIPPNNITTIGCKMQEQCSKKPKFQAYAQKLYSKRLCARRCSSSTSRPV